MNIIARHTVTGLMVFFTVGVVLTLFSSTAHAIPVIGDNVFNTGLSGILYLGWQTPSPAEGAWTFI